MGGILVAAGIEPWTCIKLIRCPHLNHWATHLEIDKTDFELDFIWLN